MFSRKAASGAGSMSLPPHYVPLPPHATWARPRRKPSRARAKLVGALLALSLLVGVPGGFLLARSMIESRVTDTIGAFHEAHRDGNHDRAMDLSCGELAASIDDGVVAAEDSEGTVDVDRVEWRRVGAATVYYHLSSDTPGSGNSAERVAKVDNVDGQWRLCEDFEVG